MQLNSFSRVANNESKMGAYYTDLDHCRSIRSMLHFPEGDEVACLEPSIGDGSAIITVTGAEKNANIKIFGVELNDKVAEETGRNPCILEVLKADFTDNVLIRRGCFSFCFGNPPYLDIESGGAKIRAERVFLDKVVNYMTVGGILVWVIPAPRLAEQGYQRAWCSNFDTLALYRFRDGEYCKYHQIVLVGKKTQKRSVLGPQLETFLKTWNVFNPPVLPERFEEPFVEVPPSKEAGVDLFTCRDFDPGDAYASLNAGLPMAVEGFLEREVSQKKYSKGKLPSPPIPLKKDLEYLLVTSGFSDGTVGSVETHDLHLMRGCADMVDHIRYNTSADEEEENGGRSGTVTVTTSTEVEIRIIENDGTITKL